MTNLVRLNGSRSNSSLHITGIGQHRKIKHIPGYFSIMVDLDSIQERSSIKGKQSPVIGYINETEIRDILPYNNISKPINIFDTLEAK